jgi:hypothetical protein
MIPTNVMIYVNCTLGFILYLLIFLTDSMSAKMYMEGKINIIIIIMNMTNHDLCTVLHFLL